MVTGAIIVTQMNNSNLTNRIDRCNEFVSVYDHSLATREQRYQFDTCISLLYPSESIQILNTILAGITIVLLLVLIGYMIYQERN